MWMPLNLTQEYTVGTANSQQLSMACEAAVILNAKYRRVPVLNAYKITKYETFPSSSTATRRQQSSSTNTWCRVYRHSTYGFHRVDMPSNTVYTYANEHYFMLIICKSAGKFCHKKIHAEKFEKVEIRLEPRRSLKPVSHIGLQLYEKHWMRSN